MGKKIKITETQLKTIVGGLVTEQADTKVNPNISPLRGKTVKLYKDANNQTNENMCCVLKISNVYQEKGLIKIGVYTNINEPNMYLEFNCDNNGFKLHNSSFWRKDKVVYCQPFQDDIIKMYCQVDKTKGAVKADYEVNELEMIDADYQEELLVQNLAENTIKETFKRFIK